MSIIKHVTLQKIVAHDFQYDPRTLVPSKKKKRIMMNIFHSSSYENLEERGEESFEDHVKG